jgi:hypothetical protein
MSKVLENKYPNLTRLKFHEITKGPLDVTIDCSAESPPVLNFAAVKEIWTPIHATCSGLSCRRLGIGFLLPFL